MAERPSTSTATSSASGSSAAAKRRKRKAKKETAMKDIEKSQSATNQPREQKSGCTVQTSMCIAGSETQRASETTRSDDTVQGGLSNDVTSASQTSFDDELEWCIAQLEMGLLRKDASKAQRQENERSIKTLRSSKAPMPRKRQLMRHLFGDYRAKMSAQPLKQRVPEIVPIAKETSDATGRFYRQSAAHSQGVDPAPKQGVDAGLSEAEGTDFRFDFDVS